MLARGDVALLDLRDDAAGVFQRHLIGGFAGEQAIGFIVVLHGEGPRLEAKGDARARIEDRIEQRVLAQLRADLGKVRPQFRPLAANDMAVGAARSGAGENLCPIGCVAFRFRQF